MPPLDGSTAGWRFPKCRFEITDAAGKPVERRRTTICGNMNMLRVENFVRVPAREVFSPFGEGFFSWLPYPVDFLDFGVRQEPGTYTVRYYYSTSGDKVSDYFGDERIAAALSGKEFSVEPEIQRRFDQVPHVELRSKELKITFRPESK